MSRSVEEPRDDEENRLWEASQKYMKGRITAEQLERIERPYAENLSKALIRFALRFGKRQSTSTTSSEDDRERYLWMISRRYMAGDLTVEQLEENELDHTRRFDKAMIDLAKWNLWQSLLSILRLGKERSILI